MSHFLDLSDKTLNMFYINSFHHPNTLVIISVPVDTASPSPLYRLSSCAKSSRTACYSIMININVIQTGLYTLFTLFILYVNIVCLLSTLRLRKFLLLLINTKTLSKVCLHLNTVWNVFFFLSVCHISVLDVRDNMSLSHTLLYRFFHRNI